MVTLKIHYNKEKDEGMSLTEFLPIQCQIQLKNEKIGNAKRFVIVKNCKLKKMLL